MLRSLIHYWRINAAVLVAVAVSTSVLTGALLVGDSVRGSLRDLTLDRLRQVDLALVAERFFREEVATDLAAAPGFDAAFEAVAPAILLRGTAIQADTRARASQVSVHGVDDGFLRLFETSEASAGFRRAARAEGVPDLDLSRRQGQVFPSIAINAALQRELGAEVGDPLLIHFRLGSEIPRDTLLGNREVGEVVGTLRTTIVEVIPDRGIGRFDLTPHQTFPLNAFVSLRDLQGALEQRGRVNAVMLGRRSGSSADADPLLESVVALEDLGVKLRRLDGVGGRPATLEVQSEEFVLRGAMADSIEAAAAEIGASTLRLQAYVANAIELGGRTLPYSMVMALFAPRSAAPFGSLQLLDGSLAPALGDDEVLLNEWAATDLGASVGDRVAMTYYVVGLDEELSTEEADFRVAGVVRLDSLAADPDLMPAYPGIEGVEDIAAWDPPFPVDLAAIRPRDEAYWDEYGGTPKAFVSEATGRRLWSTRYGATTSIRVAAENGDIDELEARFAAALRGRLDIAAQGLRFIDVKADGLEAARGATDFTQLFVSFSFFLIASAVMIVGLLFGLGVEQRAGEIGLMLAVGYPVAAIRRRLLSEAALLAALGALLGLAAAVAYGRVLMWALTTVWLPAVGSPLLFLHVSPVTLAIGWSISVLVVLGSIALAVRRLRRISATRLLAGGASATRVDAPRRGRAPAIAVLTAGIALGLLVFGVATSSTSSMGIAFGIGGALLVSGLSAFASWCRAPRSPLGARGLRAVVGMAARSTGWAPGRSLLSVALVACACFVIVTVAGSVRDPESESGFIDEEGGGYALVASSDVPLHQSLATENGRFELGLPDTAMLENVEIAQLRLLPGDDASCLNLYQPRRPRLLGVPRTQIERGGFRFGATLADELGAGADNPWELLQVDLGPDVIPVFGDVNSTQWILHLGLGDELTMENERGDPVVLRLVGVLQDSVFRSELLTSEEHFLRHFPSRSGFSYFLIDAPEDRVDEVAGALEESLARFGFDTTRSAEKLAGYLAVQNTYLATFRMLGGLGLLLGTIGLGIVLIRNVLERRGELATLRAFGFQRGFLTRLVLIENAVLLLAGVAIGALSALAALAPRFLAGAVQVPWSSIGGTLAVIVAIGMLASSAAVLGALRVPLLPALKADR